MVSRYGVSKEGAVGVAVNVGPMHCLLPHCAGPHHHHISAPHPQNPQSAHNHHVHPAAHQPPPPPSPHVNHQLSHHQLTVNINHLSHQQQQQQQTQHQQQPPPPQYRVVVTASARSEFHVPGQNYGAQPGGQVGGGGSSVGVPGARGPPPLGGIQPLGQSAAGIPPGGPAAGQQAPPQPPTPGVQSQQPQGPAPTTTPPVHTPSPQEMGKQAHLQSQPPPLQQVYVSSQTRPASQGYYQAGPRPQQPRGLNHRGGQGGSGAQVVGIAGVSGGGGQPTAIYPHPPGLTVQPTMYVQSQVPGIHANAHQQSVYPMNNQMPMQFPGPQRHQTHQNQSFYQPFQPHTLITQNLYAYPHGPAPQHGFYYPSSTVNISRASASAVSGGAQHVGGALTGAQGATVVPQGTLQQPTQPQPMPPMAMSLTQTDVYAGHNGGATNAMNNTLRSRNRVRQYRINDIVDPNTGENISSKIYTDEATAQSSNSSNRDVQPPQNNNATMVAAEFAANVMKVLTEDSDFGSLVPTSTAETSASQNASQTLSNSQSTNSNNDSQCNIGSYAPTQTVPITNTVLSSSQSLSTASANDVAQLDSCAVKSDSKSMQPTKEFQPRTEAKTVVPEEPAPSVAVNVVHKDTIPVQPAALPSTPVTELEVKSTSASPNVSPPVPSSSPSTSSVSSTSSSTPVVPVPSANVPDIPKPSITALSANPVPAREPFPNLASKTSSSSPPRRKSQTHPQTQPAAAAAVATTTAAAVVAATTTTTVAAMAEPAAAVPKEQPKEQPKDQKEKKVREKSLNSRGSTPVPPVHAPAEQHHQKANGDATVDKPETEVLSRNEVQQKSPDGKAMQKQKSKNKFKSRELNRRGAEKEGTDMDAFVNTVPTAKPEVKQPDNQDVISEKDSNKELIKNSKDNKEKDNYEAKKEKEAPKVVDAQSTVEVGKESTATPTPLIEKVPSNKETGKGPSPKIADNSKPQNVCNTQLKSVPNDVVDHAKMKEELAVDVIVAQKNEENSKVSALRSTNEEKPQVPPTIEATSEKEADAPTEIAPKLPPALKHTYKEDQWSPLNTAGKKVYDRDFLMKLQYEPNSKVRPTNLPDLDVVLKDIGKPRAAMDLRPFKDNNLSRHDVLFPGFAKTSINKVPQMNKRSQSGKSKSGKQNVIHVSLSLREDIKLRGTENAWKPTRLKPTAAEEEAETEALYKKVRSVLNKLTPQKFSTLIEQVRALKIDTQERLQGVINLVFEKAVDEPNFSVAYALMCKELSKINVPGSDKGVNDQESSSVNFRNLIVCRCQTEFEENPIDEKARAAKLKEIEECTDPEKKKDLQLMLEEEERRIRIKSVGNIRFIGELYKQGMLTTKVMRGCITHLLQQNDEDSLECLCKLLTTIGKDIEMKCSAEEMKSYFDRMHDIVVYKGPGKISSRIRFMLQDVIDLRAKKWVPRRDDGNPKTIDEIQKEAEFERLDSQLNNTPLNTPRKDDRNSDRKRNRVGLNDDGWSQPVSRTRQPYSVETSKLKNKPPAMDDLTLGSRNMYVWGAVSNSKATVTPSVNKFAALENIPSDQDKRMPMQLAGSRSAGPRDYGRSDYKSSYDGRGSRNGSHQLSSNRENTLLEISRSQSVSMPPSSIKSVSQPTSSIRKPPMSEEEFQKAVSTITRKYLEELDIEVATSEVKEKFDNAKLSKFVSESVNNVLEKTSIDRERISRLLSRLISQKVLPLQSLVTGINEILEIVDDLIIDIPKIWIYLAEILSCLIQDETLPMSEMKSMLACLKSQGHVGKLLGELLAREAREKGPVWVAEKWDQSGLQWSSLLDPKMESSEKIIKEYNLGFLTGDNSAKSSGGNQISLQQIHDQLKRLMKDKAGFDNICSWIMVNVGDRTKEPKFIRILMTAILETSIELENEVRKLNTGTFKNLLLLIQRFTDTKEELELECLYAVQVYLNKLQYPSGILKDVVNTLYDTNTIANETFLAWHDTDNPAEHDGYSVAQVALTSFFVSLQEPDDSSSVEEGPTGVNQDAC